MRTKKFMFVLLAGALVLSLATIKASAAGGGNGRLSVGAELGLPMGDLADATSIGFGGSLRYEMPMGDNLGLMLTAGYLTFSGKDFFDGYNFTMIPVQVGAKYYFQEQQNGFYGMVEVGIHNSKWSFDGAKSSTDLSYAPGIGYHLANLDLGLKYQLISGKDAADNTVTNSYLGVRIAYVFGEK